MIRFEVFRQLTKFTYGLERMGEDDQIRDAFKQLTKFTYNLERIR